MLKGGTGSGDVNVRHFVMVEKGLENAGFSITSKPWLNGYDQIMTDARTEFIQEIKKEAKELRVSPLIYFMGKVIEEPEYEIPLTAEGDTTIYILARNSGEGADRKNERGEIRLITYNSDREAESDSIVTANGRIPMGEADCTEFPADGSDISFVEVSTRDKESSLNPNGSQQVHISIEGPGEIAGFGSAKQ